MADNTTTTIFAPSAINYWYIDARSVPAIETLPLLSTLQQDQQIAVTRFIRKPDKQMSLASQLLKYLFIHRSAKIPWSDIVISRTPKPHCRPYWAPLRDSPTELEFNVSHQAGVVVLAGCAIPISTPRSRTQDGTTTNIGDKKARIQVGIDITCTTEDRRSPKSTTSESEFCSFIDIFSEAFSPSELDTMKYSPVTSSCLADFKHYVGDDSAIMGAKIRRFYCYWALKEAYVKMVGEGLMAGWLRELEFREVGAPETCVSGERSAEKWGAERRDFEIWLRGERVDDVEMGLRSYGEEFLVATAVKGVKGESGGGQMVEIDIERDIRPCAEGRCQCLG